MSADLHYSSPTTPGASSFDEDITSAVRLGEITGLAADARVGATATSGQVLDDPDGTLGHLSDGIVGLKQAFLNETTAPSGNQRVWTGYTGDRAYRRGDDSLRLGVARKVDVTLVEMNNFLDFRIFAPVADDPTSDFVRPAETDLERVAALLTDVDFLSTTLFDIGYIPTTGGVDMDANDYTGKTAAEVLNDCAQVSGRNYTILYDETGNQYVLWYDDWRTDGSDTVVYDSTLKLTNVDSERDSTTFAIAPDAVEVRDPSRVISAVWVMGKGINVYRTRPTTANTFGWRDAVMEAQYLSDPAKLAALGDRYLDDNSTEDIKITCSVQLPAALVTAIHKGQRIPLHATHLSSVAPDFVWCRILSLTVRQDKETEEFYWLDLELSPIDAVPQEQYGTDADDLGQAYFAWPNGAPGPGNLLIGFLALRGGSLNPAVNAFSTLLYASGGAVAGTDWTQIDAFNIDPATGAPVAMAWRESTSDDTQFVAWSPIGGGTARPRSHQMEIAGLANGAPTVLELFDDEHTATTTYDLPDITVPSAGYIVTGFSFWTSGPADRVGFAGFTMATADADDHILTFGFGNAGFGGWSCLAYRYAPSAGTYSMALERTGSAFDGDGSYGGFRGFWAGPESSAYPA